MTEAASDPLSLPVWAREDAFPEAPEGWGWVDSRDRRFPHRSLDELAKAIRLDDSSRICLVWTPEHPRMRLPEEVASLNEAVTFARNRWIIGDAASSRSDMLRRSILFALIVGWIFYSKFSTISLNTPVPASALEIFRRALAATINDGVVGIALLLYIIFALIPWYQARKRNSEHAKISASARVAEAVPAMRFELWLERQKAPLTRFFLVLMLLVGIAQILADDSITAAALLKPLPKTEWWRLFTAPFLHGNIIHFLMNASALLYLGKRLEIFARWPHLALVFVFSAVAGGHASAYFTTLPSVGASGGLMGWLGFLLVFETLHARLVPRSARRRLAAAVILTALIGFVGYRYIDNAAHAGGLLAGILYAAIVFPKSASAYRPRTNWTDRLTGLAAIIVSLASACFAVWKLSAA